MENNLKKLLLEIASRYIDNSKEANDMISEVLALPPVVCVMELQQALEGTMEALKRTLDKYSPDDIEYEWVGNAHEALLKASADGCIESPELLQACKFALEALEKLVPTMHSDSKVLLFIRQAIRNAERRVY